MYDQTDLPGLPVCDLLTMAVQMLFKKLPDMGTSYCQLTSWTFPQV